MVSLNDNVDYLLRHWPDHDEEQEKFREQETDKLNYLFSLPAYEFLFATAGKF